MTDTDTIILTREQWTSVLNGLDEIRDCHDGLYPVVSALITLGLQQPADTIDAAMDSIVAETIRLQGVLIAADDATPIAKTSSAEPSWLGMWLRLLNKSNREA